MAGKCLVDTNILIYHSKGEKCCTQKIGELISRGAFAISVITRIEFLGWNGHSPDLLPLWEKLIAAAIVFDVDHQIADSAIQLRRTRKMKLGDSVIAATALSFSLPSVTRNIGDFSNIDNLTIINPFDKQ